ncbi:hypothetical protein R3P38DRAFT_3316414 [Favolaschia claudopus]|uniref:Uncharacterized protein n=1 Tax=Favolaschia claudopus TaxID=2862362 RepID=A0AAW0BIF6_9AGAR
MTRSDAQYEWCKCTECRLKDSNGVKQMKRTIKEHQRKDLRNSLRPGAPTFAPSSLPIPASSTEDCAPVLQSALFSSDEESDEDDDTVNYAAGEESDDDEPEIPEVTEKIDEQDIRSDPLFRPLGAIFDNLEGGEKDEDMAPSAFDDHPAIRNAYIRVFVAAAFDGMTRQAASSMLAGFKIALESAVAQSADRLGVCTDDLITYLFLCNGCWKPHLRHELTQLPSPHCDEPECTGILYTLKRLVDGEKRTPTLTLPFVPPEKALQRMALQPGKVDQWQKWRGPEDIPGIREPSALKGYAAFSDLDKPMTDITDGWRWRTIQAGLERRRNGKWEIRDVDVHELNQQFVALPNGLILQINIDWFQAVKGGNHSTGAMYATVGNTPRSSRCLREETMLLIIFPGPREPTQEQFNNVMRICVKHFKSMYNGFHLEVHGKPTPDLFHVQIGSDASDLIAMDGDAFDSTKLNQRDPWRYLKYAFRARDTSPEIAEEISRRRGVRWSAMDELVNWLPGVTNLFDLMHAVSLTIVKHIFREIFQKNGLVDTDASDRLEKFLESLIWPVSVSRMPPSIARGTGSIKADQWRSLITVLFIPNNDAKPSAPNTKNAAAQAQQEKLVRARMRENYLAKTSNPTEAELERINTIQMNRSLRLHYENLVQFTAGIRIISSDTISPNEVKRGCGAVQRSIRAWADMHCHLVPYFHYAAVHLEEQLLRYGPAPGWWTFPYERNNGFLGRFNHNGHSGGELEGTMMRGWWKTTLIQDLIAHLESIPNPATEDVDSLNVLKSRLKGDRSERHGTLQNYIARAQAGKNSQTVQYSRFPKIRRLREMEAGLYQLIFEYLRDLWASETTLIADVEMSNNKTARTFSGEVQSFSHIWIDRRRYGAATQQRGQKAQYAYIDYRNPVRIHHIFSIEQKLVDGRKLKASCAVVSRFWLRTSELEPGMQNAECLKAREVVNLEQLSGQFVLAPITICKRNLWITIAYDHVGTR